MIVPELEQRAPLPYRDIDVLRLVQLRRQSRVRTVRHRNNTENMAIMIYSTASEYFRRRPLYCLSLSLIRYFYPVTLPLPALLQTEPPSLPEYRVAGFAQQSADHPGRVTLAP